MRMSRQSIITALRSHLTALRDAELARLDATKPRVIVHNEPVDYGKLAAVLVDALETLATGYAPVQHTHQEIADVRAYADSISRHVEDLATTPVTWQDVQGKPATFTPAPHTHPLPEELTTVLDVLASGKPGQVLVKTATGVAWEWLQPNIMMLTKPEVVEIDGVIIDPDDNYLVDPDGNYIEAIAI